MDGLGDLVGLGEVGQILEQDGKLVAAVAAHQRALVDALAQATGELGQDAIGGLEADAVVEHLEAVEVEKQDREVEVGLAALVLDGLLEALEQHAAAGQAGELVVEAVGSDPGFGALAVGDVGQRAGQGHGPPPAVAADEAAAEHPAKAAVALTHAVLELVDDRAPVDVGADVRAQAREVVVVDAGEPGLAAVAELVVAEAKQLLPATGVAHGLGPQVPLPQPVVSGAQQQLVARPSLAQLGGRARELERVADHSLEQRGRELNGADDVDRPGLARELDVGIVVGAHGDHRAAGDGIATVELGVEGAGVDEQQVVAVLAAVEVDLGWMHDPSLELPALGTGEAALELVGERSLDADEESNDRAGRTIVLVGHRGLGCGGLVSERARRRGRGTGSVSVGVEREAVDGRARGAGDCGFISRVSNLCRQVPVPRPLTELVQRRRASAR